MRIVVTGGAGFLGSHLCERFLAEGHQVVAIDNLVTGDRKNLEAIAAPGLEFLETDISEPFDVEGDVDRVYNFACPASPIDYQRIPLETLLVGSHGTRNALELARRKGGRFLQASTSECYGDPEVHPQVESYWGNVNPIGPRSCYDEGKRYGEALVMAYYRVYGMETRIVRIFNTYGPRMRLDDGRVVPALVGAALDGKPLVIHGDGTQTRSFCYATDLVDGIVRLMESDFHEPVNIGNPVEMTIGEFAEAVREVCGVEAPVEYGPRPVDDPERRRPDITRAREVLGWEPTTDLREGLRLSLPDFRARLGGGSG
jgi:dTDP-glucose 4,6-dehydratase